MLRRFGQHEFTSLVSASTLWVLPKFALLGFIPPGGCHGGTNLIQRRRTLSPPVLMSCWKTDCCTVLQPLKDISRWRWECIRFAPKSPFPREFGCRNRAAPPAGSNTSPFVPLIGGSSFPLRAGTGSPPPVGPACPAGRRVGTFTQAGRCGILLPDASRASQTFETSPMTTKTSLFPNTVSSRGLNFISPSGFRIAKVSKL